jgi:hypothetical protein
MSQAVTGFSMQMAGFDPRSAHVAFVVHKVVLRHVSPYTMVSLCQLSCHQSFTFIHPSSWAGTAGPLATRVPQAYLTPS